VGEGMTKLVPKIDAVEKAKIEETSPRYVWLDEDDNQVSPIHREFHSAMTFVNNWKGRWDLLIKRYGEPDTDKYAFTSYGKFRALTRTGKAPLKLMRVIVRISVEDSTEEEQEKAKIMLGA
jgi:hypothetical protein